MVLLGIIHTCTALRYVYVNVWYNTHLYCFAQEILVRSSTGTKGV